MAPRDELSVTVAPETGLLFASRTVTVTVLVVTPSAGTFAGDASTNEVAVDGGPTTNVTVAVDVTFTLPFTTALIVDVPIVVDRTVPVICPLAFVVPDGCTIVSVVPREELRVTVAPGTGLLLLSRTVAVIVLVAVPSATTFVGLAATVDVLPDGGPATNVTVAVDVTFTLPFTTALITAVPDVVDRTLPVICPLASVVPTGCVIVSVVPRLEERVTFAPDTGLLFASRTVTVIVLVAVPSATTLVGLAATVDVAPDGGPATNVTAAVDVTFTVPFTTALIVDVPIVVDRTVPVICPLAFVVPEGCTIVSVVPRDELSVTVAPETGLLLLSCTVTVIVLVAVPSATTLVGLAATVDVAPDGGPATNVTAAVDVTFTVPFTTALIVDVPAVIDRTVPVICPLASVVPLGCVIVSVAPRLDDRVTVAPGTGLLFVSRTVTVMVLVVVPSATTLVGLAATVEVVAEGAPAVNVMLAVWVIVTLFATAVITALPDTKDLTVATNCPLPFVVPETGVIVSVPPRLDDSVTLAPEIRLLFVSRTVTVIVLVAVPSATTLVGLATTVEVLPEGGPATNVTVAGLVTFTLPFTTALIVDVPAVVDRTVPVICPLAFVVPEGCVIVSVAPRLDDRVTVAPGTGLLFVSRTVTVIVLVAVPSATTLVGLAATVEVAPDGAPAVNVMLAVWVIVTPPATAVITAFPDVVDDTVAVN